MEDDELIAEFVAESSEHLADVERQLLEIEAAGAAVDPDLVNTVFRAVHSTKGAAGFLGFTKINQLAHEAENVLNLVRNREFLLDGTAVDVLLRATDLLRTMVRNAAHSNDVNIDAPLADLEALLDRARGKTDQDAPSTATSTAVQKHTQAPQAVEATTSTPPSTKFAHSDAKHEVARAGGSRRYAEQ